jgi:alkylhydroperoxidase family enzyme
MLGPATKEAGVSEIAWIRTIPHEEAKGKLAEFYAKLPGGRPAHVRRILSLRPRLLRARMELAREVTTRPTRLTRAQKEMLATVTSALVGCHY